MIPAASQSARVVMSTHGKSFYFASLVFSRQQFEKVSMLYRICRIIDDTADETAPAEAVQALQELKSAIVQPRGQTSFEDDLSILEASGVKREYLLELITGAEFDIQCGQIQNDEQFLKYCYWVAGVVGLMMCPLIGVRDEKASSHAVDLGIAMQITNICRDVREDAVNGRIYLPIEALSQAGLAIANLSGTITSPALKQIVARYIETSEYYYSRAFDGISMIPFRSRVCIVLAAELYRHIGVKIRQSGFKVLEGRAYLSLAEKFWVSFKAVRLLFQRRFWVHVHTQPAQRKSFQKAEVT